MNSMRRDLQKANLFALAVSMTSASAVAAPAFVEIGHSFDYFKSEAASQFANIDVDGDGLQDLVFAGTSGTSESPVLLALGRRVDGSLGIKMAKVVAYASLSRVLAWNSAGVDHILTVSVNGTVRDYSGWPLIEQRSFNVASQVMSAVVGDVDNDGQDELLVATIDAIHGYSLSGGQPEWSYSISGTYDLAVAQLDADPALEIILAGPVPGIVIDGATRATDWQYINRFGTKLATGSLLADGNTQWLGASDFKFVLFRASPWLPQWRESTGREIRAIATANVDSNGRDVILQADSGDVHVFDSNTHQERFRIPNGGYDISAVSGVDFDGDGWDEVAFASSSFIGGPLLTIGNGQNGSVSWQFFPAKGPFASTALGDVDGDGHMELVAASIGQYSYSTIAIFDANTGYEEWRSPDVIVNLNDPLNMMVSKIALVPHAEGPGMDIVLAGISGVAGSITVMDGTTHAVRATIGSFNSGPMMERSPTGLELLDFDNDGVLDYVVAVAAVSSGASGALLQVFSGVTGSTLWTSVAMGGEFAQINGVLVAEGLGGSPGKQLIAVLPGSLRSYNSSTGLLSWTIAQTNNGAFLVPNGENGSEIGVFQDTGAMTFYNASTQTYIRSYSLPAPLHAVTALGGDLHALVAASAGALTVVNGESGSVLAATEYLGPFPAQGSAIGGIAVSANS